MRSFLALSLVLLSTACPPAEKKTPSPNSESCSRFGQTCEVSPGKLGTCVQKDGCNESNPAACFVCQSQH